MPYRRTSFVQGAYYHVYNRGRNGESIFFEERNYRFLLRQVKQRVSSMGITVIAYCLMPNHYHFLLRQDGETPISLLMQRTFNSYSKAINVAYHRSGPLFDGPFKAIPVTGETYLLHLCRYIHRNPVEAGMVAHPAQWPYSNYLEWVGQRTGSLIDRALVRAYFPTPESYETFVLEYVPSRTIDEALRPLTLE
jgi:REP element-mobilizing transposase RayT